ncbi:hypothetical protein MPTK1_5g15710 [Marchantia polymorpha subsp. ruderalis]|nr:hypothetical protein MARPO_0071s0039 [Marchantia polymorpha]BBN11898.1 hypothetical protein Mp_5g15710 [Marchantia polymorpha subsp. ruderalis]|eukprot:PTQ35423.1 hypothetical protein MARPO_0071s0039 [Marchantia polymorpha]
MSGSFRTFKFPGPEPREKTRLRLENEAEDVVAHLSSSVCVHGGMELYRKRLTELGPDPLRDDADKEIAWNKMQKTKKSIGAFLMDQSMIAGIGNIYRAEILFVCGVHPNQRSSSISRSTFEDIWNQSTRLLHVGVIAGSIITVSPEEAGKPFSKLKSGERRYVYNHKSCRRCGGPVINWTIAARTCYACDACQPLIDGVEPRRKTFVDAVRSKGHEEEDDGPADTDTLNESPVKHGDESVPKRFENKKAPAKKAKTSTIAFRKRKVMDGKIVEHQALKDIPTGGLVDFPGSLDDLIWPSADPASLKGSPFINKSAEAFSFMRLPRSVAAQYGRVNQRKTVGHVAQTAEYLLPSITTVGQGTKYRLPVARPHSALGLTLYPIGYVFPLCRLFSRVLML